MPKKIEDEFSDLPISRQRKYQLRRQVEGLCIKCGAPAEPNKEGQPTPWCLKHKIFNREQRRNLGPKPARRVWGALSYRIQQAKSQTHFFHPKQPGVTLCGLNSPELRGTSEPARVNCESCFQTWHRLMQRGAGI